MLTRQPRAHSYDLGTIARTYLVRGFFRDIIAALPWDIIVAGGRSDSSRHKLSLKLLRLPHILRLSRLFTKARGRAGCIACRLVA